MQRVVLREHGIYSLPDGTQVVACDHAGMGTVFYYLTDWKLYGGEAVEAERNSLAFRLLEADENGHILRLGQPTRWSVEDLFDTLRTAN